jgi:hypothetical protein
MKQLLGDNQFFGVNHFDLVKGDRFKDKFITNDLIVSFIHDSLDIGLDGFMMNSNKRGFEIVQGLRLDNDKEIHYSVPYPHKFATMVNENGLFDLLKYAVINSSFKSLFLSIPSFLLTRNVKYLLPLIVDLELPNNLRSGSFVYLQNVVTDLLLGLKRFDLIEAFSKVILAKGFKPGFITLNPVTLNSVLDKFSPEMQRNIVVCFNINTSGFNVFPSKGDVESFIFQHTLYKKMGMSILSSGGISNIPDSLAYIKSLPLDYVVYGSSSLENIRINYNLLR